MNDTPDAGHPESRRYEIRIHGRLDSRWTAWFDGLDITTEGGGTTLIAGPVIDQAALHGLLQKVRDVGLPLLSVASFESIGSGQTHPPTLHPTRCPSTRSKP